MNILIVGQGGREHALAWKVAQSPAVDCIYVAPGNAGTAEELKTTNVPIAPTAVHELLDFAKKHRVDLTLVGPEVALAAGISDVFQAGGLAIFGPTQLAAQLETSKVFSKQLMAKYHLPTAAFATFTDSAAAITYLKNQNFPIVIKADGLAAGKGVLILNSFSDARQAVIDILDNHCFGDSGRAIIIEEFLVGEELSFMAMVDGKHILPLATSRDYKKREDQDRGPNTGGMGAYTPVNPFTQELSDTIMTSIMKPTLAALQQENIDYVGFLYAGLMINPKQEPKLLEFNVRLGDPETQPLMMRLQSDLVSLIQSALRGELDKQSIIWDTRPALTVVLTAGGYPLQYDTGELITGLDQCLGDTSVKVFHAGTKKENGTIRTHGGRVLNVTALGNSLAEAKASAYAAAQQIHWEGCYYRQDIGV